MLNVFLAIIFSKIFALDTWNILGNMPGIKRSRDESENDEGDQETETEGSTEEQLTSSEPSDSEDSSGLLKIKLCIIFKFTFTKLILNFNIY